jgi:hypothetical protein
MKKGDSDRRVRVLSLNCWYPALTFAGANEKGTQMDQQTASCSDACSRRLPLSIGIRHHLSARMLGPRRFPIHSEQSSAFPSIFTLLLCGVSGEWVGCVFEMADYQHVDVSLWVEWTTRRFLEGRLVCGKGCCDGTFETREWDIGRGV